MTNLYSTHRELRCLTRVRVDYAPAYASSVISSSERAKFAWWDLWMSLPTFKLRKTALETNCGRHSASWISRVSRYITTDHELYLPRILQCSRVRDAKIWAKFSHFALGFPRNFRKGGFAQGSGEIWRAEPTEMAPESRRVWSFNSSSKTLSKAKELEKSA